MAVPSNLLLRFVKVYTSVSSVGGVRRGGGRQRHLRRVGRVQPHKEQQHFRNHGKLSTYLDSCPFSNGSSRALDTAYLPSLRWPDESQRDIVGAPLVKWLQKSSQAMPNCQEDDNADIPYIFAILFLLLMKKWIVYFNSSVAVAAIIIN